MEVAFGGLPGFINSGNIFVYLLCARFCSRQCEGYTFIYDINMFIFSGAYPGTKICTHMSVTEVLWQVQLCGRIGT